MGKLLCGETLKRYRINGPPAGYHHTGKEQARRIVRARRQATQALRDERKRLKAVRWQQRQRIKLGLPLLNEAELD